MPECLADQISPVHVGRRTVPCVIIGAMPFRPHSRLSPRAGSDMHARHSQPRARRPATRGVAGNDGPRRRGPLSTPHRRQPGETRYYPSRPPLTSTADSASITWMMAE